MRQVLVGAAMLIGCLLIVQTTAATMERQAMRGHEISDDFTPPRLQSDFVAKPAYQGSMSSLRQPAPVRRTSHT